MLYQFLRNITITLKPVPDADGKIKLHQKTGNKFKRGIHEVKEEVENHPFFQMLIEKEIVLPMMDTSARAKEAIEKAEDKAARAAAKAAARVAEDKKEAA